MLGYDARYESFSSFDYRWDATEAHPRASRRVFFLLGSAYHAGRNGIFLISQALYRQWGNYERLLANNSDKLSMFVIGNVVAYIVAIFAIKGFIELIKKYGFALWGYYRIIVGGFLLWWFIK